MPDEQTPQRGPFREALTITILFGTVLVATGLVLALLLELAGVYLGR